MDLFFTRLCGKGRDTHLMYQLFMKGCPNFALRVCLVQKKEMRREKNTDFNE
jgi:hypothetical protein